jgi:Nif-specific regulatory protein
MHPVDDQSRQGLLFELSSAFAARLDLDELLPLVVTRCPAALDAEGASVLLLDPATNELYFRYVAEADPRVMERLARLRFPADQGIAGAVLSSGQPLRIDDVASDPRFNASVDRESGFTTRALLCVPLRGRDGPVGVLQVLNPRHGPAFTAADLDFLQALAGTIGVALENAGLFETVRLSEGRLREQLGALKRDLARYDRFTEIVGTAPGMQEVFRLMDSAAGSPIAVLIEGETGTGKELVARGIHRASARADAPFIGVNCAALAETLLDSELFGHRKGAFTGAVQDRRGVFEAADGGTIFLDEVGEMPLAMQAKLLRVLQEGEVTPVGDHRLRRVDVRVVCATNRDLTADAAAGHFRSDLYYRLAAFPIRLPPLRERAEDIPLLTERILREHAERHGRPLPVLTPAALERLLAFAWPGNVRELQNELERALALAGAGQPIRPEHLSAKLTGPAPAAAAAATPPTDGAVQPLREARTAFEIRYVADALRRHRGNVSATARALGISRVALQKKMKQLGLRDA